MANGTGYFFSHDYNSRSDEKIKSLLRAHGMLGYGIFWAIVEDLYNNANALRLDCEGMAYDYRCDVNVIKSVVFDYGLFVVNDGIFGSMAVQKRLDLREEKSLKASLSARKRWGDANALQTQSDSNAIKERKGKEKNDIKEIEIKEKFERFWDLYGKKKDRDKSLNKFSKLSNDDIVRIFETLPTYIQSTPDIQFRKNPLTYLNGKCWNDEIILDVDPKGVKIDRIKHPNFPADVPYTEKNIYYYNHNVPEKYER